MIILQEMFKMARSLGADLHVLNRQNLTPFTLAAFLAKKEVSQIRDYEIY